MKIIFSSIKLWLISILAVTILYYAVVYIVANVFNPDGANGSLVYNDQGVLVGSKLIGQEFTSPKYFWSRPSFSNFNVFESSNSNFFITGRELRDSIENFKLKKYAYDGLFYSKSGVDPHISVENAISQVARIADARKINTEAVSAIIKSIAYQPIFGSMSYVNVLQLNLELDSKYP